MNRALVLALFAGLAMTPAAASSSETYRLCGPEAAGFIRAGGAVACVGGSLEWRKQQAQRPAAQARPVPQQAPPQPVAKPGANRMVDDALNSADLAFNDGEIKTACGWVRSAITSDVTDFGGVPSSKEQREQLKKYAQRCNLRY